MNKLFICLLYLLIFAACKSDKSNQYSNRGLTFDSNVPADFLKFYMRFHQDSLFQMEHITFPMDGIPNMAKDIPKDSLDQFKWLRKDWIMHKPFNYSEAYTREYVKYNDELITELIVEKSSGFGIERRFSKMRNKWYLIYFVGMNQIE